MSKTWRNIAIVLFILLLLAVAFISWAFGLGTKLIRNEDSCKNTICKDYDAWLYENDTCYCYLGNDISYEIELS